MRAKAKGTMEYIVKHITGVRHNGPGPKPNDTPRPETRNNENKNVWASLFVTYINITQQGKRRKGG